MSLCKHGLVGSPFPSGNSVGKASVARNGVVYIHLMAHRQWKANSFYHY